MFSGVDNVQKVKMAMLATQRYSWEQGVCMQALYESGDIQTAIAMAHNAVLRMGEDGRLAIMDGAHGVTDPAANGEAVWRAYDITGDRMYLDAARKMLQYLTQTAPKTDKGILCHTDISYEEGFSDKQIWADSIYMAPPFIAAMGAIEEAVRQIAGMYNYLIDKNAGLLRHQYDAEKGIFIRDKFWATGNAWALMGMGRVIDEAVSHRENIVVDVLIDLSKDLLDHMLPYMTEDGRFHDVLDDEETFLDGTSAMMTAAFIYRGLADKWLDRRYRPYADKVFYSMDKFVDEYGIIHGVCGCPDFKEEGTSPEAMAAYLMMHAWADKN